MKEERQIRLLSVQKVDEINALLSGIDAARDRLATNGAQDPNLAEVKRCSDAIYELVRDLPTGR